MGVIDRILGVASPSASLRRAIRLSERGRGADAFPLLAHAAKAGIPEAEYRVARCYLEGTGVPPSRAEGTLWLKRAAAHGNVQAQVLLSVLYIQGWAIEVGADQVSSEASRLFASDVPSEPNFPSAVNWARKAAVAGSAEGQALLGYVPVQVDLDKHPELAVRFGVDGIPHLAVLDSKGAMVKSTEGELSPSQFIAWLHSSPADDLQMQTLLGPH